MNPKDIKVIQLAGTPRQRGHAYGEECRIWIGETIARWKADLAIKTGMDPDEYIALFLQDTRFPQAVERWTPDLLDELEALAQGAGQDLQTMFAWQLPDEQWWHQRDTQLGIYTPYGDHCSSLGVQRQGDLPPMIAQNMDMPRLYDGMQIMLHIKYADSPLEILSFTSVGLLTMNGVNNMGVAQVQNTLLQLDHNASGLPLVFVARGILEKSSLCEAVRFVKTVTHASGQNFIIGTRDGIVDLECSGHQAVEYLPHPGANKIYHTNHPFENKDTQQFEAVLEKLPLEERQVMAARTNSWTRFRAVKQRMEAANPITVDVLKQTLRSHDSIEYSVCVHNEKSITVASMVIELLDEPVMHVCFGPPCMNEYTSLGF